MRFRDTPDVFRLCRIRKALVVNDDIVRFRPINLVVEIDHRLSPTATYIDHFEIDIRYFLNARSQREGLVEIVVAATARDDESLNRSARVILLLRIRFLFLSLLLVLGEAESNPESED